ncbi:MAG: hypothetical protein WAV41_04255 [Microgenomates group bacterium]
MTKVRLAERTKPNSTVADLMHCHDMATYGSQVGAAFILPRGVNSEEVLVEQIKGNGFVIIREDNGRKLSLSPHTPIVVLYGHLPSEKNIGDRRMFGDDSKRVRLGDALLA